MLSALLILMTGFVGGVAVTVALGVGLYFVVKEEGDEPKDWSPPSPSTSPTKAPVSPEPATRTDYGASTPRPTPPSPQSRSCSVDLDPWRY